MNDKTFNNFKFRIDTRDSEDYLVESKKFNIQLPKEMWEYLTEDLEDGKWRAVDLYFDWRYWEDAGGEVDE